MIDYGGNMIPKDPAMLLSYMNTQLRDNYPNLEALREGLDISEAELKEVADKLESIGYKYDEKLNKFN